MSDISKLRKPGSSPFPSIRRSTDILQPESGEIEFSEALKDFDTESSRTVKETERSEQTEIKADKRKEREHKREEKREREEQETEDLWDDDDSLIDIEA